MSKRPEHATDCPGCDTGWTASGLLCPLCESTVNTAQPDLYLKWMDHRAKHAELLNDDDGGPNHYDLTHAEACLEAFYRGVIIGTARVLSAARAAEQAAWKERKAQRRTRK